jgi:thioredoxin 1
MNRYIRTIFAIFAIVTATMSLAAVKTASTANKDASNDGKVTVITAKQYATLISDYSQGAKSWKFKGSRPAIVDVSATWCGPCRRLGPILEELAKEYSGKIDFYKLDIDANKDLAMAYGISSVPSMIFCPMNGRYEIITGLYPKEDLVKTINYIFFKNK